MLVMMIQHYGQSEEVVLTMNILFKRLLPCVFVTIASTPSELSFIRVRNNGKTKTEY